MYAVPVGESAFVQVKVAPSESQEDTTAFWLLPADWATKLIQ